ncbi:hypothetical protein BT93_B0708 [Corymbia citriodora subsp. variegata]|nr:hypothetical protein BT93_B0708 [Corymbia citriodora subsp. variegata]
MASTVVAAAAAACLAVISLQLPALALGDVLSPLLSPIADDVCKEVKCGRGTCKPSGNSTFLYGNGTFLYECECEPGWKQTLSNTDQHLRFLPCVIPNCTLNYSCMKSPASAEEKARQANESIFNPCHWVDCGGGSCNKTSIVSYSCLCDEGYYNLFNLTAFPCYQQCSLMRGSSHWLVAMMFFLGLFQCP